MIGNHNSNRNIKKKLFLGITKTSPTKIIIQTDNETCTNIVIDNTDHNTQKTKTNINNVHFDDDIGQYPQNMQHEYSFKTSTG